MSTGSTHLSIVLDTTCSSRTLTSLGGRGREGGREEGRERGGQEIQERGEEKEREMRAAEEGTK